VILVWGVQHEPLPDFEHGGYHVHVLLERQHEVLPSDGGTLAELFVPRYFTKQTQHNISLL
jgi:hypothetical protein